MNRNSKQKSLKIINDIKTAIVRDDTFYPRLLQEAGRLTKIYFWKKEAVIEKEDIITELIDKMISGERKWDGSIPIEAYMFNNIESVIYNHSKKEYRKVGLYKESEGENSEEEFLNEVNEILCTEETISEAEKNEFFRLLESEIGDDNGCIEYYLGIRDGSFDYTKNKSAAEVLGKTTAEVENIKKRFLRHCNKVFIKYYS